jgi:hypothetical protein
MATSQGTRVEHRVVLDLPSGTLTVEDDDFCRGKLCVTLEEARGGEPGDGGSPKRASMTVSKNEWLEFSKRVTQAWSLDELEDDPRG